jgi:putative ABC transport system substrate-binding protein
MNGQRVGGLVVLPDSLFTNRREGIAELALRQRLPSIYGEREYVETGGLMSYGESLREFFRRAATFVDKILKGTKPADLPIEQPTRFLLVINFKTAKAIGLEIPPMLLATADEVIE